MAIFHFLVSVLLFDLLLVSLSQTSTALLLALTLLLILFLTAFVAPLLPLTLVLLFLLHFFAFCIAAKVTLRIIFIIREVVLLVVGLVENVRSFIIIGIST